MVTCYWAIENEYRDIVVIGVGDNTVWTMVVAVDIEGK